MANTIKPEQLSDAIQRQLEMYTQDITVGVNEAGRQAADKLLKKTKATAPKLTGSFRRHIAIADETSHATGMKKYLWYVKAPEYRLTHLLVHGHATVNGGRTKADPFLANALETVLPEYEKAVEEALKYD